MKKGIVELVDNILKVRDLQSKELHLIPKSQDREEFNLPGDTVEFSFEHKKIKISKNNKDGRIFIVGKIINVRGNLYFKALDKNINIFIPKNNIYHDMYAKESKNEHITIKEGMVISGNVLHKKNSGRHSLKINVKTFLGHQSDSRIETAIAKELHDLEFKKIKKDNILNYLDYHINFCDNREDLTNLHFLTIDNETTKDIDDALFATKIDANNINLKVAISDTSHYILKNSEVDHLAFEKTSTLYFPQNTDPMIPQEITNEICSINPYNIKKTIICDVNIQIKPFAITQYKFSKANIISYRKTHYEEVDEHLSKKRNIFPLNISQSLECLNTIREFCPYINEEENNDYYANLDTFLKLDKTGKINHITAANSNTKSHKLVEASMVIANKCAADFLLKNANTGFYRTISDGKHITNGFYTSQLPKTTKDTTNTQNKNNTHFDNSNFDAYTHFTSPIRRYADLVTHRLISNILNEEKPSYNTTEINNTANHINEQQKSIKAAIDKSKNQLIYEYAKRLINTEEQIHIIDVTDKGYQIIGKTTLIKNFVIKGLFPEIDTIVKNETHHDVKIYMNILESDEFNEKIKVKLFLKT